MKKKLVLALFFSFSISLSAQIDNIQFDQINRDVMLDNSNPRKVNPDSLGSDKEIPKGIKVWTVDKRFGDIVHSTPDTLSYVYEQYFYYRIERRVQYYRQSWSTAYQPRIH